MKKLTEKKIQKMKNEAIRRMTEMQIDSDVIAKFQQENKIHKVFVNHDECRFRDEELTDDELNKIRELEMEKGCLIYYVSQDKGLWPDGEKFPRYTYMCVSHYENDWTMEREGIAGTNTIPAYVENLDAPEYLEYGDIVFRCELGRIVNLS